MIHQKNYSFIFTLFIGLLLSSCKSDSKKVENVTKTDNFPREKMLRNWGDNIIVPGYQHFSVKVGVMSQKTTDFTQNPTTNNLKALRSAWETAYIDYQKIAFFNVGKAKENNFIGFLNTYPASTKVTDPDSKHSIDENIKKGIFDLAFDYRKTKQGFGALDYMLNGLATTDAKIISFYTTNTLAENYKKYLQALVARIKTLTDEVLTNWNGDFKTKFIANTGNSGSSSTNIVANGFMKYFEVHLREAKIATPSGVRSSVEKNPKRVEAYYKKDISKKLFITALKAMQDFYNGKSFDGSKTGDSFKQYLEYLDKKELAQEIDKSFNDALKQGNKLKDNFANQVETDNAQMVATFEKLQGCVRLLKTDMLSTLNIQITYQDADGD